VLRKDKVTQCNKDVVSNCRI